MKKLIIIFLFLITSNLFAEAINEYKSDIYFANGVGAIERKISKKQGEVEIKKYKKVNSEIYKNFVGKYDLAFNTGRGVVSDFFEAWLQYTDENPGAEFGWSAFKTAISYATGIGGGALKITEAVAKQLEFEDITTQVKAYRQSVYNGHKVIVIAHSQGNFFTNKAYKTFDTDKDRWMQNYFVTIGLASPSDKKIKNSSYLTYDNDPIVVLNGAGTIQTNPMRYYTWYAGPNVPVDNTTTSPCLGTEALAGETPYCSDADWIAQDSNYEEYHAFSYYMSTDLTRDKVYSFLTSAIDNHKTAKSQWKFKEPTQCTVSGCENKLREVEHEYDTSLDYLLGGSLIYPFKEDGKLYSVIGHGYVKASYGGESIYEPLDENICFELKDKTDNTIETIDACSICQDPSTFEILSHQNINTKEWRVTVKNKDTNETQEGVYPFNLEGSLYKLDSGEWVLASCGGESIESSWSGQEAREWLQLSGTNEIIHTFSFSKQKKGQLTLSPIGTLAVTINHTNGQTFYDTPNPKTVLGSYKHAIMQLARQNVASLSYELVDVSDKITVLSNTGTSGSSILQFDGLAEFVKQHTIKTAELNNALLPSKGQLYDRGFDDLWDLNIVPKVETIPVRVGIGFTDISIRYITTPYTMHFWGLTQAQKDYINNMSASAFAEMFELW